MFVRLFCASYRCSVSLKKKFKTKIKEQTRLFSSPTIKNEIQTIDGEIKSIEIKEWSYFHNLKNKETYREKPKYVWVKDKNDNMEKIHVEEIEKRHQFHWKEDIFFSSDLPFTTTQTEWWTSSLSNSIDTSYKMDLKKIEYYLNHIEMYNDKFALLDMNELGFGVVANHNIQSQRGDFLTFYAGKIESYQPQSTYSFETTINGVPSTLDASHIGNISRFMPHLPHPNEIDPIYLSSINIKEMAIQNVDINHMMIGRNSVPVFDKYDDIKAGDVIGFSYGHAYWKNQKFWLFEKTGKKMAEAKYDSFNKIQLAR